jgi:hypothetical protein
MPEGEMTMGEPTRSGESRVDDEAGWLAELMQEVWDGWCADAGCIPTFTFRIAGPPTTRVYADFAKGEFVSQVITRLNENGVHLRREGAS